MYIYALISLMESMWKAEPGSSLLLVLFAYNVLATIGGDVGSSGD